MGVCVCVSANTALHQNGHAQTTCTLPELNLNWDQFSFDPEFGSRWQIFHLSLCQKCWQYECCHIHGSQYTFASTVQLEIGPDPADAIADGNLLKIKQGRKILNVFWQCPRVFINQSLRCCFFSACRGRMFHGEVINQLQVCFHKAGKQLIRC